MLVAAGKFGKTDAACSHCCLALCGVDGKVRMRRSRDDCWLAAKAKSGRSFARMTLHAPIAFLPCGASTSWVEGFPPCRWDGCAEP